MLTCLWLILKIDSYSTIEFNQFFTKDTSMIFFSFGHPPQMNLTFQDHLNKAHSTIKFSFETFTVSVPFLDVSITKEDNCCHVKPYLKCTNTFSYMTGQSYHPPSVFKRITRGENIRILRNCSKKQDYVDTMTSLKKRFKERKIPHKYVEYPLAPHENRHLFFEKQRNRDEKNIPFVSSYNSNNILSENWSIFANNSTTRKLLLPNHVRVSYTHHKNLAQKLLRANLNVEIKTDIPIHPSPSKIIERHPAKNIQCRNSQCETCVIILSKSSYYSFQTKIHYIIKDIYSCDTVGGIYLLECIICRKQYVGETGTTIRSRIKHHRNASKSNLNRPIYKHIKAHKETSTDIFSLSIIDKVDDMEERKEKEKEYIHLLKTQVPFALNVINK